MKKIFAALLFLSTFFGVAQAQGPTVKIDPNAQIGGPLGSSNLMLPGVSADGLNGINISGAATATQYCIGASCLSAWPSSVNAKIVTADTLASCGDIIKSTASGAITITLPSISLGCKVAIQRGSSAGVVTIAPPSGVTLTGVTNQLPQSEAITVYTDGTQYYTTLPILPGPNCTLTPSSTGNTLNCDGGGSSTSNVSAAGDLVANPSCFTSSYGNYELRADIKIASGTSTLVWQVSSDGGTTWDSSSTYSMARVLMGINNGTAQSIQSTGTSGWNVLMYDGITMTTGDEYHGSMVMYDTQSTTSKRWIKTKEVAQYSSNVYEIDGGGANSTAGKINDVRLHSASGTFTGSLTCIPLQ